MLWNAKCSVVAQPAFGIKVQTSNQIVFSSKKKERKTGHMLLIIQSLDD